MNDNSHETLLKLCWLIRKQQKAEIDYSRAQWRVGYLRKVKASYENGPSLSSKARQDLLKKIELARLDALKKQKQLLFVRKKLRNPINKASKKLNASLVFKNGRVAKLVVFSQEPCKTIEKSQIDEIADQYEANVIFDKIITK